MVQTISLLEADKRTKQYEVMGTAKATSGAVLAIIEVEPRKDVIVQINAGANTYDVEVTSHTGDGNDDLDDAAVPWILLKDAITIDFHTGQALENRHFVGIKITCAVVSGSFEYWVGQDTLDEIKGK